MRKALAAFYASPARVPAAQRAKTAAAVSAVKSGPLGKNAVPATIAGPRGKPMPFNPLHTIAFHALDQAYKTGYVMCGSAALLSLVLAGAALGGLRRSEEPEPEPGVRPAQTPA